ncbi:MAG TPA: PhnD/SsuA/transferrin family substrate-binding protein [Nocardioides sp.]|nr:PhnD/SsuA/transferrin family substrate-binding protein [Nocardioides sp.]
MVLLIGSVAYDPKVVTIWDGFRAYLRTQGVETDYVLYSNYERQVEDLLAGRIDLAWNSPLAWVRSRRLASAQGVTVTPIFMRDTDRDLRSAVVTLTDGDVGTLADLKGKRIGVGAIDSPQATLIPSSYLRGQIGDDYDVVRFDVGVGLHGDHVGGERDAVRALRAGEVDAACVLDANLLVFSQEGSAPAGTLRVLGHTDPYDHCMMTAGPAADPAEVEALTQVFLAMSYADPGVRRLLDLEGLTAWLPGRVEGFAQLERAVDETGFYSAEGGVDAVGYRP